MPLPSMPGDASTIMSSEGMGAGMAPFADAGQDQAQTTPQDQARGAVQLISGLRKQTGDQLKALATQFPSASKDANELQQMFEQALQRLLRTIVASVRMPEQAAPQVLR